MLSDRKKALINWACNKAKDNGVFLPSMRLQKFLFFYECFSKTEGDEFSFDELKGYKRGPVFGDVFREMKYNPDAFLSYAAESQYTINEDRAERAFFLMRVLGSELSDFTHSLNIWKTKEDEIIRGGYQLLLSDSDFSESDAKVFLDLLSIYPVEYINSVTVIEVNGKAFLFPK
jgi:uncharacterized phage-associated protein